MRRLLCWFLGHRFVSPLPSRCARCGLRLERWPAFPDPPPAPPPPPTRHAGGGPIPSHAAAPGYRDEPEVFVPGGVLLIDSSVFGLRPMPARGTAPFIAAPWPETAAALDPAQDFHPAPASYDPCAPSCADPAPTCDASPDTGGSFDSGSSCGGGE